MPVESRDLLDGISRAWTHPGRRAPNDTPITHPLDPGRPYTLSLSRLVHPPKTHVLSSPAIPNARRDRKTTTGNDGEPAAHTLFYTAIITTSLSRYMLKYKELAGLPAPSPFEPGVLQVVLPLCGGSSVARYDSTMMTRVYDQSPPRDRRGARSAGRRTAAAAAASAGRSGLRRARSRSRPWRRASARSLRGSARGVLFRV